MPDSYYTIPCDKGSVNISEEVIAAIAANALTDVDGISAFSNTAGTDLGELIGKKPAGKGVRVSFSGDNVRVDVTVLARFGVGITGLAEKAQRAVASAVEAMTGLTPTVNVIVSGVSFEK